MNDPPGEFCPTQPEGSPIMATRTPVVYHDPRSLSSPPVFEEIASRLVNNGYQPIPIKPGTKFPSVPGWQIPKSPAHYNKIRGCEKHGVGLLTSFTPAIDIDIKHQDLVYALYDLAKEVFDQETMFRIGNPPKALLVYRDTGDPFPKQFGPWFVLPNDDWRDVNYRAHRIEILYEGNMFVAYAKHPGTGKPYEWYNGSPLDIRVQDLPGIDYGLAKLFLDEAWRVCLDFGALPVRQKRRKWIAGPLPEIKEEKVKTIAWWKQLKIADLKESLGLKRSGRGWACRCPVHCGEHDNSLNIYESDIDGTLMAHCYAGCTFEEVSEAICEILDEQLESIS